MTEQAEIPADKLLETLFNVVLDELRSNKGFAERLVAAFPREAVVRIVGARKKTAKSVEPPVSLSRMMNREGETALRDFLKKRNKAQLRVIVERQQIPLA